MQSIMTVEPIMATVLEGCRVKFVEMTERERVNTRKRLIYTY